MSIRVDAEALEQKLIEIRRKIHENPELGFQEFETARLITTRLDELGIPYKKEIAKTGIVATIKGEKGEGKTLLIRADMDALPLLEETTLGFKSKNEGVFHACGHDSHVSCLLGTAELLQSKRDQFKGTVLLIFQPAEEGSKEYDPTGKISGGALPMILEAPEIFGTFENPKCDGVLALHVAAGPEVNYQIGTIGVKDGPFTGSADELYIDIIGKGGHASTPHTAVDPVYLASQINVAIQGWLSRVINPMEPVVITFGKIIGGSRQNIIPVKCRMEGTLRTLNEKTRDKIKEELPVFIKKQAQSFGGDADITILTGYPVGSNDKIMNDHIRKVTAELYGSDHINEEEAQLGAEDFYEFGFRNKVPIAMFWLGGTNPEKNMVYSNHSNYFDFDEKALAIGTTILTATALSFLNDI
ncbi:MAG: M20 family metallopeptidase [Candidatus Heimdallarchaeota archaeon]|nr:M20 family metallopeptidase [Candidatus Heimdallarchaeota archaeon]